jgi:hypothetical protein
MFDLSEEADFTCILIGGGSPLNSKLTNLLFGFSTKCNLYYLKGYPTDQ